MILKLFFFSVITLTASLSFPNIFGLKGLNTIFSVLNTVDLFDGPAKISHAPLPTPTKTTKPTVAQIRYYNYYAASAYCSYELKNLSCQYCAHFRDDVKSYKILNNSLQDTRAIVTLSETREEIVVTYRGSYNVWNALQDITLIATKVDNTSPIKIHTGFHIAAQSLYSDVVETVGYLRSIAAYSDYKIVIVGHSLGAAMARVTLYFLLSLNQFPGAVYEIYGYGEPRSGNKPYADYLNSQPVKSVRVVHRADIVPHVPPTSVLGTKLLGDYYLHVATEYWANDFQQKFCSQSVYEDPKCSDSIGPLYYALDHLKYFDADYATCAGGQPLEIFELPLPSNIPQPDQIIPPLPTFISSFTGGATDLIINTLTAPLG